jgi:hypothetical protein
MGLWGLRIRNSFSVYAVAAKDVTEAVRGFLKKRMQNPQPAINLKARK